MMESFLWVFCGAVGVFGIWSVWLILDDIRRFGLGSRN